MIATCNVTENNEVKTSSRTEITVTEISKRAATDVRDSYVLFNIKANKNLSNYHLAVKETNEAIPTATEMIAGALKRNLSTNSINVLIAQRMNAPMIDFARTYFADNSQTNLGTNMRSLYLHRDIGLISDDSAVGAEAWVAESVLKPSTQYVLYGMNDGGTQVAKLLTVTTDSTLGSPTYAPNNTLKLVDTTLEAGYIEIAINANEYYIFPHQVELNPTLPVSRFDFYLSTQAGGNIVFLMQNEEVFSVDDGYRGSLYLFKTIGTELLESMKKGCYVLLNTQRHWTEPIPEQRQYGLIITFDTLDVSNTLRYSILKRQL